MRNCNKTLLVSALIVHLLYVLILPLTAFAWDTTIYPTVTQSSTLPNTETTIEISFPITQTVSGETGGGISVNMPDNYTVPWGPGVESVDFLVNNSQHTLSTYNGNPPIDSDAISWNFAGGYNLLQIVLNSTGPGLAVNDEVIIKIGTYTTYQQNGDTNFSTGNAGSETYYVRTAIPVDNNITYADYGTVEVLIEAATGTPEFSTYTMIMVLIGGGWIMYRHQRSHEQIENA